MSLMQCCFKLFMMQLLFHKIFFVSEIFQLALSFNVDTYCPIVYEDPLLGNSERSSYFGYSVAIVPSKTPRIIIGAPRSNSSFFSDVYEPGAVFTCPIKEKCKMLQLELPPVRESSKQVFNKSTAWIGGSIDAEDKEGGILAMCSPRMKYVMTGNNVYLPGACYWMKDINSSPYFATPMTENTEKFTAMDGNVSFYNLAVAQYGMSVHFPNIKNESRKMLGGAPGVYNWKGSVVLYEDISEFGNAGNKRKRSADTHTLANSIILEPQDYYEHIRFLDYFGYQVSSGRFFQNGELLYVSSSPRGASQLKGSTKCTGSVMIFRLTKSPENLISLVKLHQLSGIQIGEYFGASIAVVDINGDFQDDLIVGSPHYFSSNGNEGKVYIYYATPADNLKLSDSLYGAGQFGLAVASLGDLNQDGYGDFAVGAPYEGNGAIYIYNGRRHSTKMTQKITPEDLYLPLRGFGISFSRPIDLDDNKFPDFAVGSYLSGHTVVLRSYPAVTLTGSIYLFNSEVEAGEINTIVNQFFITLYYSGKEFVDQLIVERKIEVDSELKRFNILYQNKYYSSTLTEKVSVKWEESDDPIAKSEYRLLLKNNVIDTESSVRITATHTILNDIGKGKIVITNSSVKGEDKFCKFCAVHYINEDNMNLTKDFTFKQKCEHGPCKPDLKVECNISSPRFVIGSSEDLSFDVTITNLENDPARQVAIIIEFENVLKEKVFNKKCNPFINNVYNSNINRTQIKCSIGTLTYNKSVNMSVLFDTASLEQFLNKPYLPVLNFSVTVQTSGKDIDGNNDKCSQTLELDAVASIKVFGKSEPDQKYFVRGDSSSNSILQNHIYQINQEGQTPVWDVAKPLVKFHIPQNITQDARKFTFLTEHHYMASDSKNSLVCHDNSQSINIKTKENMVNLKEHQINMYDENNSNGEKSIPSEDITMYINCSMPNVDCIKISCQFAEFQMFINMTFNITALEPLIGKKNVILIASYATSQIDNKNYHPLLNNTNLGEAFVATPLISTFPPSPVRWWIILLAIILGILLLALIMYALVKFGFFHREKKEQLESLKNNDSLNDKSMDDTEVMEDNIEYSVQ